MDKFSPARWIDQLVKKNGQTASTSKVPEAEMKVKDLVIQDDLFTTSVVTQLAAYIFRGEELHALSHLVREAQEIFIGERLKVLLIFIFKYVLK